jgi:hypothetical protein
MTKYDFCISCKKPKKTISQKQKKYCRSCAKIDYTKQKYKGQDVIFVKHKAGNRKEQSVVKFKDYCVVCKKDKGYVFKSALNKKCLSCASKESYVNGKEVNHNFYGIRDYVITPNQGGVYTRSSYETFYLKYLNSKQINYFYEPRRFVLSDNSSYLLDVYLVDEDRYIELKGFDRKKDKEKFEKLKKEYPELNIEKLTKKDLVALGYSPKLYTDYRYIKINSEIWKVIVLEPKDFEKVVGSDSDAITYLNDREIIFKFDKLDYKTIAHEICHVYYSYSNTDRIGLDSIQYEEFISEFVSNSITRIFYSILSTQEVIQDICNKKYNIDIKINYMDLDLSEEQFDKLKKAFSVSAFRYNSFLEHSEKLKKMKASGGKK